MRILAFTRENYPQSYSTGYVLLHQSMALEEMGHEVHIYNLDKHSLGLMDYLQAYDFDLLFLDMEFLRSQSLLRILVQYRSVEPVHVVGALYKLPAPPDPLWEVVDFAVTPWKGEAASALAARFDLRYLPLAYNPHLHKRKPDAGPSIGGVFVGNTGGLRQLEAGEYLTELRKEHSVLCIGPYFEEKYLDPFALGNVYAATRCLPNFHYSWEKAGDCMLNERFWQSARCGVPVNDYSSLMDEVFEKTLLKSFCFADRSRWQERVRRLNSGAETVSPELLQKLDQALAGHSYQDRMRQLLEWIE